MPENAILFIDEIHRLNKTVEEFLYSAMENYAVDIIIGKDGQSKSIRLSLPKFTLIGATTRAGLLSAPLRDRFGNIFKLEFYTENEMSDILKRSSAILDFPINHECAITLAKRTRGTPRLANRLLKKVRDFIDIEYSGESTLENIEKTLDFLQIDIAGLDKTDRTLLLSMINDFEQKPVGLETLAAILSEDKDTIKDVNESFLIANGFIQKTPRGRIVTKKALAYFGIKTEI